MRYETVGVMAAASNRIRPTCLTPGRSDEAPQPRPQPPPAATPSRVSAAMEISPTVASTARHARPPHHLRDGLITGRRATGGLGASR
jgi:hypothetical protein